MFLSLPALGLSVLPRGGRAMHSSSSDSPPFASGLASQGKPAVPAFGPGSATVVLAGQGFGRIIASSRAP